MKTLFLVALFSSVLNACTSVAQITEAVDPLIEDCIGEGGSHQVWANINTS